MQVCEKMGRLEVRVGVKEVHLGDKLQRAVLVCSEQVQIVDLLFADVTATIARMAYPRTARLSSCQRFVLIYFTDNAVGLYCTRTGTQIEKVMGIPRSCGSFSLAGNSRKLLFGNNNTLCLWNISKGGLEISSNQWRNINCYALDDRGRQMALGTYQGTIVVLTVISEQKVTEMELKKHKSCVMLVGWGKGEGLSSIILSVSYDKVLLTSVLSIMPNGERGISYKEMTLDTIPRGVGWHANKVYLFEDEAVYWLEGNRLRGHADGRYAVSQLDSSIVMIRYAGGVLEWFKK